MGYESYLRKRRISVSTRRYNTGLSPRLGADISKVTAHERIQYLHKELEKLIRSLLMKMLQMCFRFLSSRFRLLRGRKERVYYLGTNIRT
jgi:hypothetical protein